MSVPNDFAVISAVYQSGTYNLANHDDLGRFVDDAIVGLHTVNANWGHLKKKPSQTNIHGHAEDAALYKHPDGTAQAVDFITGAGGPNPSLRWGPDSFVYSHSDWLDPGDHDGAPPPPSTFPGYEAIGGDAFFRQMVGVPLQADMAAAGQALNDGSSVWFSRTCYSLIEAYVKNGNNSQADAVAKKHRNEWRAILGQPPL